MNKFAVLSFTIVGLTCLIVAGCGEQNRHTDKSEEIVHPENVTNIRADSVITFYAADGSRYLSRQRHSICPRLKTILISANEPWGNFGWKLAGNKFSVVVGANKTNNLPITICDRNLALVILTSIEAAGDGFSAEATETTAEPVKIEGKWYQPIELRDEQIHWARRIGYRNVDSKVIDMVSIEDINSGKILVGRSYNYRWIKDIERSLPMKIDIFDSNHPVTLSQRIAQVSYQRFDILKF